MATTTPKGMNVSQDLSIDEAGPVDVDATTRRIDELAAGLDGHRVDLLASDDDDLTRVAALRRLAPKTTVLLGSREAGSCEAQPLAVLLEALLESPDLEPESLATEAVQRSGPSPGLVALRSAGAKELVAGLDDFGGRAIEGSAERSSFESAWNGGKGGDLTGLIESLEVTDRGRAGALLAAAKKTVIAPISQGVLGIGLDGRGLQLGATSAWTRLVDSASGYSSTSTARVALDDLQSWINHGRRMRHRGSARAGEAGKVLVYEYQGATSAEAEGDISPDESFATFLEQELGPCNARHVVLVVRGTWDRTRLGSVAVGPGRWLSIATLAGALHDTLRRSGRSHLAMVLFEDSELLRVENAYELRDVAHVLLTIASGVDGRKLIKRLGSKIQGMVVECEEMAAGELGGKPTDPIAPLLHKWRRRVAVRLATALVDSSRGAAAEPRLQGLDLAHIATACDQLDHLCRRMFDNLADATVLEATLAGEQGRSLIEWINMVQMAGFYPILERTFKEGKPDEIARDLSNDWGKLYNWLGTRTTIEDGEALWIGTDLPLDRTPDGYGSRLLISIACATSQDYRAMSFHQNVSFRALLAAARTLGGLRGSNPALDDEQTSALWGLISMGITYGPSSQRGRQLGRLCHEPGAEKYFRYLGVPPLLRLSMDKEGANGYELRLESSEAQAVLIRCRNTIDMVRVDGLLDELTYVMSRSMASREGSEYVEALGASLAEDVIHELCGSLETERTNMLRNGRGRAAHLALGLPRDLMRYPWELMQFRVPGREPRFEMLAQRFAVGRQMWTDRELRPMKRDKAIRMLIVADPPRPGVSDLPAAREEGKQIRDLCERMREEVFGLFELNSDTWIGESMTRTVLRQLLRTGEYDVLHFAGHGRFDAQQPDRSGWMLSDGILTVTDLNNTLAGCEAPPWLIYANACDVGMIDSSTPQRYHGDVYGMADACIRAGVSAYVAPLWRIHDESACMLASEFYRCLLLERATIGRSLQQARVQVGRTWSAIRGDAGLGDISWAGMVLYGNPAVRLREIAS